MSRTDVHHEGAVPPSVEDTGAGSDELAAPARVPRTRWVRYLSFRNIGAVYVWALIVVVFSFWAPDTFPTWQTVQSVLNQSAIAGLMALALVVPLSARVFDLSVGNAMGLCNVIIAWLMVNQGVPMAAAIALTLVAGVLIGLINATVVIGWRIDSFIATLATGSLMAAAISLITADQSIIGPQLNGSFANLATASIAGIQIPVFAMFAVAGVLWYVLVYTATGRRLYSTGFNEEASRLTGIHTKRLKFVSLLVSGTVAGVAAILLTSQVTSGTPGIGPPYLLDAFAAAFLGATQLGGRFNAWGTVIAVLLLGTGKTGLILVGAPAWASSMFSGVVLLLALAVTNLEHTIDARSFISRRRSAKEASPA